MASREEYKEGGSVKPAEHGGLVKLTFQLYSYKLGMMAHICNYGTREAEEGRSLVQGRLYTPRPYCRKRTQTHSETWFCRDAEHGGDSGRMFFLYWGISLYFHLLLKSWCGWRGGSVVRSTGCSFRGPGFNFQHLVVDYSHPKFQFQGIQCHFLASLVTRNAHMANTLSPCFRLAWHL